MGTWGQGDGGGGPQQADIDLKHTQMTDATLPTVKMAKLSEYFNSLTSTDINALPTWNNEMYLGNHRVTYTSQGLLKKYNRVAEVTAEEAEKFSSTAMWLGAISYPYEKITRAWGTPASGGRLPISIKVFPVYRLLRLIPRSWTISGGSWNLNRLP